jgi:hypothetical protein
MELCMNITRGCRTHPLKYGALIEIFWGSSVIVGRVRDMSASGLFIETLAPLWIGATFEANLMLRPPLRITCTVCRIEPNRGMGVQVTFEGLETRERLANELDRMSQSGEQV